jgi:bifunctional enzyme CysN/CysC
VIDEDKIQVVWVGEKVTTDITCDIHVESRENLNEGVVKVKHLLQDKGIVFKP